MKKILEFIISLFFKKGKSQNNQNQKIIIKGDKNIVTNTINNNSKE